MSSKMLFKRVKSIAFSPVNPEELKKYAVCEIKHSNLYTKSKEPEHEGINDPRMGPVDNNLLCSTCTGNTRTCPGHFGYIDLAEPVFNPLFMKQVLLILNITCCFCSSVLVDKNDEDMLKKIRSTDVDKRFSLIFKHNKAKKVNKCFKCDSRYVKFIKDRIILSFVGERPAHMASSLKQGLKPNEVDGKEIYATDVIDVLRKISDEDITLIGMNPRTTRPEWLLFQLYPVVPPCVRPAVSYGSNLRSEDDLVYKLVEIVKNNKALKDRVASENFRYLNVYKTALQWAVSTMIDNDIKGVPQSTHRNNGRALKSFKARIKGKTGRLRGNIGGKRVEYSARTVIGPDPNISIDQVGVPFEICKTLTFPEVVNDYNIRKLDRLVKRGPHKYPGANYLLQGGKVLDLRYTKDVKLKNGDIVKRHLLHDDYVIFNRQPSLHKMSMMGHRVRPIRGKSFRLNPATTVPYNADYDGDEMNIFLSQNMRSIAEVRGIASVPRQIISPQSNSPIIGCIMDNVVGSAILTSPETFLSLPMMHNIAIKLPRFTGILPPPDRNGDSGPEWSGRTVMSMLLPKGFNFKKGDVIIRNGQHVAGVFDKKIVGASAGGLVHMINNDISEDAAKDFVNNLQYVTNRFLMFKGFSVGYDDIKSNHEIQMRNLNTIDDAKRKVDKFIKSTYAKMPKITQDDFEEHIFNVLNKARDDIGSLVMKTIDKDNSFYKMIKSGAKGNVLNISQILGSVGQQNSQLKGTHGRVPMIINNRSLPYYHQFDASPEARGFVEHSYVSGLTPTEFFYHMQAGREGCIDTACKTSDVGYLQRKLIKSLEDIKVCYDLTVRNEGGRVVQFAYGGNNFDTTKVERQYIDLLDDSITKFDERYLWSADDVIDQLQRGVKVNCDRIMREYSNLCKIRKTLRNKKLYEDDVYQPINVQRLVKRAINKFGCLKTDSLSGAMRPKYVIRRVEHLCKFVKLTPNTAYPFSEMNEYNLEMLRALIRTNLASKNIIVKHRLSIQAFDWIVTEITAKFYKSIIDAGTAAGPIAAQSIGQPCTQLSVAGSTRVKIQIQGTDSTPLIGDLIDSFMEHPKMKDKVVQTHITEDGKPSHILDIPKEWGMFVPGIKDEKAKLGRVTQFSRHPPNGRMVKVTTKSGKVVIATLAHSFVSKRGGKVMVVRGDSLKVGDVLPVIL